MSWIDVGGGLQIHSSILQFPVFANNPVIQQGLAANQQKEQQAQADAQYAAAQRQQQIAFANAQRFQQQAASSVNAARRSLQILGSNQANVTATARQTKRRRGRATRARTSASLRIGGTPTSSGSGLNIAG